MADTRIRRILVANRGEIAARVIRTCRALGIQAVAVHSDADADAPYVALADRAVRLPGVSSTETYLDGAAVIAAAVASGADAIHPGYGFLSENPAFARAVVDAGLTWIGPSPQSIESMALKVEAKRIAAAAGVPLAPGAELPSGMMDDQIVYACARVGYPLIIKASAGGGGKGMRVVTSATGLVESVAAARREAASAFGDDTVFAERYLAGARHVEVQVVGDMHRNVIHLFERECSIQRRHQKIIEEAPSPGVTPVVRVHLHEAAVALAKEIGYVGVGTVEFMVSGEGEAQEFFFLEMNTRLQVEHPVTEAITGFDLVALQISVAQGELLPVRQADVVFTGHAIEARLYAEDPARGYLPATGTIHRFAAAADSPVRIDTGVASGSVVTSHYDPMLAKVIAHGPTRDAAAGRLADGLARMELHGPVTNRDSLVATLRSDAFLAGDTTTAFLDEHPEVLSPEPDQRDLDRHALSAAAAVLELDRPDRLVPIGWRNVSGPLPTVGLRRRGAEEAVVGAGRTGCPGGRRRRRGRERDRRGHGRRGVGHVPGHPLRRRGVRRRRAGLLRVDRHAALPRPLGRRPRARRGHAGAGHHHGRARRGRPGGHGRPGPRHARGDEDGAPHPRRRRRDRGSGARRGRPVRRRARARHRVRRRSARPRARRL